MEAETERSGQEGLDREGYKPDWFNIFSTRTEFMVVYDVMEVTIG